MGAISHAELTDKENAALLAHLRKHKTYPYLFRLKKAITAGNFTKVDAPGGGSYFTFEFRPNNYVGVISFATNLILSPNTTIGRFAITMSYNSVVNLGDNTSLTKFDTEAQEIYQLVTNGGAINDYQVTYPLNWFVERAKPLFIHIWADAATVAAGTATLAGHIILGTLIASQQ